MGHLPAESRKMDKETALSELKALCAVICEPDGSVPERYLIPWRGDKGAALAVVAPVNIEEVRRLISFAVDNNCRLLPQGERTGLVGSSVPEIDGDKNTIVVSMERFRSRIEYRHADRRVVVDSGYTLDEINDHLKTFGMHLPINVSSNPMVGGMVATNIGGSRVVKFGDARKLLLGIEVVLADDEQSVYSTLDRPRKDNSSPNFSGVFCGSFGSYGIITGASFEVFPILTDTYTAWMSIADGVDISKVLEWVEDKSGDLLLACEFVSRQAVETIAGFEELKSKLPLGDSERDLVFVEWGTSNREFSIEQFAETFLQELSETELVDDVEIVPSQITWQLRHQFSDALKSKRKLIGNDISVPRDRVSSLRSEVARVVAAIDPSLAVRDFGHLGDGGLHFNVIVEGQENIDSWTNVKSDEVRFAVGQVAVNLGGSFSAEHGLGSFNTSLYEQLTPGTTKYLSSGFKTMCDPHNVLGHSGIVFGTRGEQ